MPGLVEVAVPNAHAHVANAHVLRLAVRGSAPADRDAQTLLGHLAVDRPGHTPVKLRTETISSSRPLTIT